MKTKETCQCQVCGEQFTNITDHMLHYIRAHDDGYKEHEDRRKQTVTCGACLKPMKASVLVCECGHEHWSLTKEKQ
jgi:hypothetical protein